MSIINTVNFLGEACSDEFYSKTLSNYFHKLSENYSNLVTLMAEITSYDELPEGMTKQQYVDSLIQHYGFNRTAMISFNEGYCKLGDLCDFVINQTDNFADVAIADSGLALTDKTFQLLDMSEDLLSTKISLNDVFEQLKSGLHSTLCFEAAFDSASLTDLSNRVNVFKDKIQAQFSNVFDDITGTFTYLMDKLGTKFTTCGNFLNEVLNDMGVRQQAEDENFILNDSDLVQYTGATPVAAVNFDTALGMIGAAFSLIGDVVGNLFRGLFNRAKSKVQSAVINYVSAGLLPVDLELVDEKAEGSTVDGWGIEAHNSTGDVNELTFSWDVDELIAWENELNKKLNHWLKFNFIGCEMLCRPTSITWVSSPAPGHFSFTCDFKIKTKPILNNVLVGAFRAAGFNVTFPDGDDAYNRRPFHVDNRQFANGQEAAECLSKMMQFIKSQNYNKIPTTADFDDESTIYPEQAAMKSFINGYYFTEWLLNIACTMLSQDGSSSVYCPSLDVHSYADLSNTDWIRMLSGYNGSVGQPQFTEYIPVAAMTGSSYTSFRAGNIGYLAINLFCLQQFYEANYPLSFPYLPYQNDVATFDTSKYAIKTDEANQATWETYLTRTVAIVIVAIAAIVTTVVVRKIRRALLFKRLEFCGRMDNKMWQGGSLTQSERRKYIRYSRKLNACGILTGGIQQSVSDATSSMNNVGSDSIQAAINNVYTSIIG